MESALVLLVPQAEPVVAELRRDYDPVAVRGMPAHVTLLYPFLPPPLPREAVTTLSALFARVRRLNLVFAKTGRFAETLYLEPEEAESLRGIISRIVECWPQYPPYGGRFGRVIPHLTVADRQSDQRVLEEVQAALERRLPIRAHVRDAHLFVSRDDGLWRAEAAFPLA